MKKTILLAIVATNIFANSFTVAIQEYNKGHYKKAIELYKQAADENNYKAESNLAYMYQMGIGTKVNYQKAMNYYRRAYRDGSQYASYNIGIMYYVGQGVQKNYKQAAHWWRISALHGNEHAVQILSILCAKHPNLCHFKGKTSYDTTY